jgi:hypothetical protein
MATHDTQPCRLGHNPSGPDPVGDQMVTNIVTASTAGLDVEMYLTLRQLGDSHEDILSLWEAAQHKPTRSVGRYMSIRALGYSNEEASDACWRNYPEDGSWPEDYHAFRQSGASHSEAMAAETLTSAYEYIRFRAAGANHSQTIEAATRKVLAEDYTYYLDLGATHLEALDLDRLNFSYDEYENGTSAGIAHADLISAVRWGIDLDYYVAGRQRGLTHSQLSDLCRVRARDKVINLVRPGRVSDRGSGRLVSDHP